MDTVINNQNKKVHMISLGCSRNRVDSEVMLGTLFHQDWKSTEEPAEADVIIVNTCGFIQAAKEESIDEILGAASYKEENPNLKIVVTGCLTQRYKRQLEEGLPEVDLFIGTDEFPRIAELLDQSDKTKGKVFAKRTNYLYGDSNERINTLNTYSAYVKVAEGCQHNCSFCIIPAIRGQLRSRHIESVVKEVEALVEKGVIEVNLIAQDLAAFGRERGQDELLPLLKALCQIEGLQWVRMLYMYPENISDEFLEFFASEPKLVKYLDIPIQHGSDRLLKSMNRGVTRTEIETTVEKVREKIPGIAIRTSVMVGFPGETEQDFNELRDFVTKNRIEHLGCFAYSQEDGTVAGRMENQIDDEVKEVRLQEIMAIQKEISRDRLQELVGQTLPVLVFGPSSESDLLWEGRLMTQAPEVDGIVYLNDGPVKAGTIQSVKITEAHDYDLVGHVLDS